MPPLSDSPAPTQLPMPPLSDSPAPTQLPMPPLSDSAAPTAPDAAPITSPLPSFSSSARGPARPLCDRGRIEPLSEGRYRLELTASAALHAQLLRARDLMRHQNPTSDLGLLVERAVALLVAELENKRLGKTARRSAPRRAKLPSPERVTAAVRRAVFRRDGEQCTFTDVAGHRCEERGWLQLDHALPRGRGGDSSVDNVRVLCRTHNLLAAERVYGREHVARKIHRHLDQPR